MFQFEIRNIGLSPKMYVKDYSQIFDTEKEFAKAINALAEGDLRINEAIVSVFERPVALFHFDSKNNLESVEPLYSERLFGVVAGLKYKKKSTLNELFSVALGD